MEIFKNQGEKMSFGMNQEATEGFEQGSNKIRVQRRLEDRFYIIYTIL
jgi:hypothetical protein